MFKSYAFLLLLLVLVPLGHVERDGVGEDGEEREALDNQGPGVRRPTRKTDFVQGLTKKKLENLTMIKTHFVFQNFTSFKN